MKLKLSVLLGIAKKNGYTGSDTDSEAVRKFLIEAAIPLALDGVAVDLKSVEIVDGQKKATPETVNLGADAVETKSVTHAGNVETVIDMDTKIAAGVESALKKLGVQPGGRPASEVKNVKSVQEGMYELKVRRGHAAFKTFKDATIFSDWMLAKVCSRDVKMQADYAPHIAAAQKRLEEGGVIQKGYATTPTAAGGALVPEVLIPDLMANLLQYGKTRQLAKVVQMSSNSVNVPSKSGIHTLSYPAEGAAPSAATAGITYANQNLTAKMGTAYTKVSRSLEMDSIVNIMDDQATELVRCVAYTEDHAFINGVGAPATGGMVGIIQKFGTLGTTTTNYVLGGGNWAAYTMIVMAGLLGKIPDYARANSVWLCSPEFAGTTLARLSAAQGGVTWKETLEYGYVQMFLGRPIVTINTINANPDTGASTVDVIFGDIARAAMFGDRMSPEIDVSDQPFWTENNIGIKITVRHDINWWDPTSTIVYGYQS